MSDEPGGMICLCGPTNIEVLRRPDLSHAEWHTEQDPYRLLEHAVPRIPYRHTYLVLAEILEAGLPLWRRAYPDDPTPERCAGLLRAWCLGRAPRSRLVRARAEAFDANGRASSSRIGAGDRLHEIFAAGEVTFAAAAALAHVDRDVQRTRLSQATAVLFGTLSAESELNPEVQAHSRLEAWFYGPAPTEPGVHSIISRAEARRAREEAERRQAIPYAELIRRLIPFPWRASRAWRPAGNRIRAGDALLILEGERLVGAEPLGAPDGPMGS